MPRSSAQLHASRLTALNPAAPASKGAPQPADSPQPKDSASGSRRLSIVEGLRGYLALWVLVCHVLWSSGFEADSPWLLPKLAAQGRHAVELFMIISGFVIFFLLDTQKETYGQFIVRRFFRIFPVFLLLFLFAIPASQLVLWNTVHTPYLSPEHATHVLTQIRSWWSNIAWHVPLHLLMLHGAVPPLLLDHSPMAFLAPAWSLSVEWQFYLIAPVAFTLAASSRPLFRISASATSVLIFAAAYLASRTLPASESNAAIPWLVQFFFIGCASYFFYKRNLARPFVDSAFPVFATLALFVFMLGGNSKADLTPLVLWIAFMGLLLEHPASWCSRTFAPLFANRWACFLGRISYSLYLSHLLFMAVAQCFILKSFPDLSQGAHFALLLVATVLISIPCSAALYDYLEAPANDLGKLLARKLARAKAGDTPHGQLGFCPIPNDPNNVDSAPLVKSYKNDEGIILLAEDREEDACLLKRAFRQAGIPNPIVVVSDGDEAVSYLEGTGKHENSILPVLLLLDLKMPNRNGFEVLKWIRQHPTLQALRVVVLTVSESASDINRAYQLGANSFLVKTMALADIVDQARQIKIHWIDNPSPDLLRLQVVRKAG